MCDVHSYQKLLSSTFLVVFSVLILYKIECGIFLKIFELIASPFGVEGFITIRFGGVNT